MTDLDQLTQSLARNLKHWRAERNFTLDALAARSGVSRGMIIQIEQARTNPSVGTTVKLADALGISITTLLDYEHGPRVRLVPEGEAVQMWSTGAGSHTSLLIGAESPGPLEMWDWRVEPGDESASDPHPAGTVELLRVTAGVLTLVVDGEQHTVPAGTAAAFEADVRHTYRNDGTEPVTMTMVVAVPPVARKDAHRDPARRAGDGC
ncbi:MULTISPECIES: helix-turn-helix domain-containing protein [Streptomyces]|uniref:helix-turn-helix domain-containing protein n=1 Tax=Streptomyces TaxID=1883 RepID=UPI00163C64D5|nr:MULTISPECIES: XRE family transcriptional regulator [Streptomyces]MBC2876340.1 helix-turn-helix transcriptional regulator [Streptomyces sp. TYQ1024]UBI35443.1 XRE family transcriptional regulator [Streptomyces mobaraensis]UKW28035.1 XRE family transcriptional regulator [Streptomyces sp. TYQ1024]